MTGTLDTYNNLTCQKTGVWILLLTSMDIDWDCGYFLYLKLKLPGLWMLLLALVAKKELRILVLISLAMTGTLDTITDLVAMAGTLDSFTDLSQK